MRIHPILSALIAAVLLAGTGCREAGPGPDHGHGHGGSHGHDHDHEEGPRMAQITVWTGRYEVFAEHPAPVARQAIPFATHLTDLRTREPRREGMVKFVMRQGATVAEHPQAAPARPGIYQPRLTFPQPGDWQLALLVPDDGTNTVVELGLVRVYGDAASAAQAELPEAPEGITFLKEQQWKIHCQSEPVTRRRLVDRLRVPARVRAKPGQAATLAAPVSGQLVAAAGHPLPQPGQRVEAGQLLAWLKPNFSEAGARMAEAQAGFATARAVLEQTEAAFERTKRLASEQAKSVRELQEAQLALETARARHAAAAGLLATFRQADAGLAPTAPLLMELRAPITGVLNAVAAGPGETVLAQQTLLSLLNPDIVWIEAGVPEASLARVGEARDAAIELPGEPRASIPITGEGRGRLLFLGLEVDPATRTVPLLYETANPEGRLRV
ncbi:MAG: efflux RND transporter periplasmic adaptor subunit, partial [Verrucomicrobiota bacterium]